MKTKMFEVRDYATFIPVICVEMSSNITQEQWLLKRLGFSPSMRYIQLMWVSNSRTEYDPFKWGDRTMFTAHKYIREHWEELSGGEVIDVQFILEEKDTIKKSEREE